jgi:hypothetical protein
MNPAHQLLDIRCLLGLLIAGALILPASSAIASDSTAQRVSDSPHPVETGASSGAANARQVFIDPQTGERRQPADDETLGMPADELGRVMRIPREGRMTVRPNGMKIFRTGSRHMDMSRAHVHQDGTVSTNCTKPHDDTDDSQTFGNGE